LQQCKPFFISESTERVEKGAPLTPSQPLS